MKSIKTVMSFLLLTSAWVAFSIDAAEIIPKAFVYTEVQNSVEFEILDLDKTNEEISKQPGFLYKTWLSGLRNNSVGGFYAFDSLENAQKYVTEYFANVNRKQGSGYTTRIFDAAVVEEASRGMGSVDFGGKLPTKPAAFVYTEIQVSIPFNKYPWRQRNPILRKQPGFLAKTWLSGINTNTVGGFYAFDSLENAKRFALEDFPKAAAKYQAATYVRIFDAGVTEDECRKMHSPYFVN